MEGNALEENTLHANKTGRFFTCLHGSGTAWEHTHAHTHTNTYTHTHRKRQWMCFLQSQIQSQSKRQKNAHRLFQAAAATAAAEFVSVVGNNQKGGRR